MGLLDLFKKKVVPQNADTTSTSNEEAIQNKSITQPLINNENASYIVRGKISEDKIHLGSYFFNPADREDCYLVFEDNIWYIQSEVQWYNIGGQTKDALDSGYFVCNDILTIDDLLSHIYSGSLKPCREQLQTHTDILSLLSKLIEEKTTPNYIINGLSLLWDYNRDHSGVVIHKCFSSNQDKIEIPEMIENYPVVALGGRSFVDNSCRKLILPSTIREIAGIFCCSNITEILIPEAAEKCDPFLGCVSLKNIFVSEKNKNFRSIDGVLYTYDLKTLVRCPQGRSGKIILPDVTTTLDDYSFSNCQHLTGVTFSNVLAKIGMNAFENCKNISEFILPDSVAEISWGAFANIDRYRIICKEGSFAYNYLEKNFSNPYWHGNY